MRDPSDQFSPEFWNERYRSAERIWSGQPNPWLVEHASRLTPGTALDIGSGEGADAIWLANRGWQVTGVDVSTVALERARRRAAEIGTEVATRIYWQQGDLLSWDPAPEKFDLVSSQFMQLPGPARLALLRRLTRAVRPGGTLLYVGHHPTDPHVAARAAEFPDRFFTAEQLADDLVADEWQDIVAAAPERHKIEDQGQQVTVRDAVLHAVRADAEG